MSKIFEIFETMRFDFQFAKGRNIIKTTIRNRVFDILSRSAHSEGVKGGAKTLVIKWISLQILSVDFDEDFLPTHGRT